MSLKAFHIVFMIASIMLALVVTGFAAIHYRSEGDGASLALAVVSSGGAVVMLFYGRWFMKKLRHLSYL